jgi:uncharacterized glyoxalase superfamily protein PhnB
MHSPNRQEELNSLLPNYPTQQPFFHKPFNGEGIYLSIDMYDVDTIYNDLKNKDVEIKVDLRDEPWDGKHIAIADPNGIGIGVVKYSSPQE